MAESTPRTVEANSIQTRQQNNSAARLVDREGLTPEAARALLRTGTIFAPGICGLLARIAAKPKEIIPTQK